MNGVFLTQLQGSSHVLSFSIPSPFFIVFFLLISSRGGSGSIVALTDLLVATVEHQ